jgi:formiminotetrahydrofolate cyclodeaminase
MPGGGGIATVVGILGASMTSMVVSLTRNLPNPALYQKIPILIESLKELYQADIDTFNRYLSGLKMPKETVEQQVIRSEVLQKSLIEACEIPLKF